MANLSSDSDQGSFEDHVNYPAEDILKTQVELEVDILILVKSLESPLSKLLDLILQLESGTPAEVLEKVQTLLSSSSSAVVRTLDTVRALQDKNKMVTPQRSPFSPLSPNLTPSPGCLSPSPNLSPLSPSPTGSSMAIHPRKISLISPTTSKFLQARKSEIMEKVRYLQNRNSRISSEIQNLIYNVIWKKVENFNPETAETVADLNLELSNVWKDIEELLGEWPKNLQSIQKLQGEIFKRHGYNGPLEGGGAGGGESVEIESQLRAVLNLNKSLDKVEEESQVEGTQTPQGREVSKEKEGDDRE